jgi:hypothetical protein
LDPRLVGEVKSHGVADGKEISKCILDRCISSMEKEESGGSCCQVARKVQRGRRGRRSIHTFELTMRP